MRCMAKGSRVDTGGLASHICNENYDEGWLGDLDGFGFMLLKGIP
jgi:hypothetical protein